MTKKVSKVAGFVSCDVTCGMINEAAAYNVYYGVCYVLKQK